MKNKDGHLGIVVVGGTGDAPEADTSVEFLDLTIAGAAWEKCLTRGLDLTQSTFQ